LEKSAERIEGAIRIGALMRAVYPSRAPTAIG
jgi:hypothetical protein